MSQFTEFRNIPTYSYNSETKLWEDKQLDKSEECHCTMSSNELKCATFNVLFDIYQNNIVQSEIRYVVQLRMLEKLQLDVLSLNEMTPQYLIKLMNEEWVQNNYYLSETETGEKKETGHSTIVPYGNLLLISKHKFNQVQFYKYKFSYPSGFSRRTVLAIGQWNDRKICFGSVHLKAKKECFEVRKKQCMELHALANHLTSSNTCDELIYLGDWNLNMPFETHFISHHKEFTDLWLRQYGTEGDKGYTMDSTVNPMITKMNPNDDHKQLRLDRVVQWKATESQLECHSIRLFATNSIKKLLKNKLIFSQDEAVAHSAAKDYLYCSDHFGIYLTLQGNCREIDASEN